MTLLARVTERLQQHQIPFVLIGASALAAHGVSRSTLDIDLLVTALRALEPSLWTVPDLSADIRRGADDDPLAGVVRLTAAGQRDVDIVVGRSRWQGALLSSGQSIPLEGTTVPVVDAVGLILLKLYAGGPQDLWDIEQLLAANDRLALASQVDDRVEPLPLDARRRWQELRG